MFIRDGGIIFAVIEITMELQLLLLFMVFAAIAAVQIEDLLSSVIAVGAVGLGLSMPF